MYCHFQTSNPQKTIAQYAKIRTIWLPYLKLKKKIKIIRRRKMLTEAEIRSRGAVFITSRHWRKIFLIIDFQFQRRPWIDLIPTDWKWLFRVSKATTCVRRTLGALLDAARQPQNRASHPLHSWLARAEGLQAWISPEPGS
jgi:hypothetical protein